MELITIMNLSGVMERSSLAEEYSHKVLELKDLSGVNCYCDDEAAEEIRTRIASLKAEGIHFIDSGNYHYLTRLWIEKIREPFRLMVFDNHTDLQPPAFGDILSCGGWIDSSIRSVERLDHVLLAGPDEAAFSMVPQEDLEKVSFLSREQLKEEPEKAFASFFEKEAGDLPLYISIDKDILSPGDAVTNWSQGDLRLSSLLEMIRYVFRKKRVIGCDICGECGPEDTDPEGLNERADRKLLELMLTGIEES